MGLPQKAKPFTDQRNGRIKDPERVRLYYDGINPFFGFLGNGRRHCRGFFEDSGPGWGP